MTDLLSDVAAIEWYHSIDLGHGVRTPGKDDSPLRLARLGLPPALNGLSVLDIGAWDGFFSFEAERRGATRVLATDSFSWGGGGWGSQAGFNLARRTLGSKVEDLRIDVMDLSPERVGSFDVVLFLGVLYHLRHPLLALERIASVSRGLLIVETVVDMLDCARPAAAFYPDRELNDDPTNWWAPNLPALHGMLHAVGYGSIETISPPPSAAYRTARAWYRRFRGRTGVEGLPQDRAVVHARKP
jgi:tRNA (mo5U34)-methyltransferase